MSKILLLLTLFGKIIVEIDTEIVFDNGGYIIKVKNLKIDSLKFIEENQKKAFYELTYDCTIRRKSNYSAYTSISCLSEKTTKFTTPEQMTQEDVFKIFSFALDSIFSEEQYDSKDNFYKAFKILIEFLNNNELGFKWSADYTENDEIIYIPLHHSEIKKWYVSGTTFEDIKQIYSKCNIEFCGSIIKRKQFKI